MKSTKPIKRKTPIKRTGILRRTPIKRVSSKRQKEMKIYTAKREEFLKRHPYCMVTLELLGLASKDVETWDGYYRDVWGVTRRAPLATDIHHCHGRRGKNYLDETTWLAVCREQHQRIHQNPSWAREMGFLK